MKKKLIVILGPTAVGKTSVSLEIATFLKTEIISFDSRQFYKELKIGSAPPDKHELKRIPHHFIHNLSIKDNYNSGIYENEAINKLNILFKKYDTLIAVGGSGLYLDAICKGFDIIPSIKKQDREHINKKYKQYGIEWLNDQIKKVDPKYYSIVDKKNPRRLIRGLEVFYSTGEPYSSYRNKNRKERSFEIIKIGLYMKREDLYEKINQRVDSMIKIGLLREVISLQKYKSLNPLKTVGYDELFKYLENKTTLEEAITEIKQNTRRLAKRQITWFKKDKTIEWFNTKERDEITSFIESH